MKYLKYFSVFLLVLAIIVFGVLAFVWVDTKTFTSEVTHQHSFSSPYDYDKVRKILVRSNSLGVIVRGSAGELLDERWVSLSVSTPKRGGLLRGVWELQGEKIFTVRVLSGYPQGQLMVLRQVVSVTADRLVSVVSLAEPHEFFTRYETRTEVSQVGQQTQFVTQTTVGVRVRAPQFYLKQEYLDQEVSQSVTGGLVRTQKIIEGLIEQYKDVKLPIPISGK
jgi:hypothetical protein